MKKKYQIPTLAKLKFDSSAFLSIPDETKILPFFNSQDIMSDLPFETCREFSVAAGIIEPTTKSKIHLHPHINQLTFVVRGQVTMHVKMPRQAFYSQILQANESLLSIKGSMIQYENNSQDEACELLYIVGPPYVFLMEDGKVVYDDSVMIEKSWEELKENDWGFVNQIPSLQEREKALDIIRMQKNR